MTIQWQESSFIITNIMDDPLDLNSLCKIQTNFQVMQVQIKTSDESSNDHIISTVYRDLICVLSQSNTNSLPQYQDENHALEVVPGKTLFFALDYKLFKHQLEVFHELIDENLPNRFICPSTLLAVAPVFITSKPDGTLRLYMDYCRLNPMTLKN